MMNPLRNQHVAAITATVKNVTVKRKNAAARIVTARASALNDQSSLKTALANPI